MPSLRWIGFDPTNQSLYKYLQQIGYILIFKPILLQKGIKVRTATQPFDIADQHFAPGAYVINRGDNRPNQSELDGYVLSAAAAANVTLHPIFSGYSNKGPNLGSDNFHLIKQPEVAIVYGDEVDENSYGHTWFFFEHEAKYPVTALQTNRLSRADLGQFTTIVFPNGQYSFDEKQLESLQKWVRGGGRLIALEGAVKAFADKDGFDIKSKEAPKKDSASLRRPFMTRQRDGLSDGIPGAIVHAKVDNTNPIAYGLAQTYFSLKTSADMYQMPENAESAIWIDDDYLSFGFIGSRVRPQIKKTPIVAYQTMGEGSAVYFADNPLFRSFWQQGKLVFANAVFF